MSIIHRNIGRTITIVGVAAILGASAVALAAPGGRGAGGAPSEERMEEFREAREGRIREVLAEIGVDSVRIERVIAVKKTYGEQRMTVARALRADMEKVREMVSADSRDEAAYERQIAAIRGHRERLDSLREQEVTEVQKILKPSEQAKVLVRIADARGRRGGRR